MGFSPKITKNVWFFTKKHQKPMGFSPKIYSLPSLYQFSWPPSPNRSFFFRFPRNPGDFGTGFLPQSPSSPDGEVALIQVGTPEVRPLQPSVGLRSLSDFFWGRPDPAKKAPFCVPRSFQWLEQLIFLLIFQKSVFFAVWWRSKNWKKSNCRKSAKVSWWSTEIIEIHLS